jgi:hypothetical protein
MTFPRLQPSRAAHLEIDALSNGIKLAMFLFYTEQFKEESLEDVGRRDCVAVSESSLFLRVDRVFEFRAKD